MHWLVALPIGLIVLPSLMFVQHRARRPPPVQDVAAPVATVAALEARAAPAASAASNAEPVRVDAPSSRTDADADTRQFQQGMAELQRKRPRPALAIFEAVRSEPLRLLGRAMARHDMRHASESQLALELLVRDHGHGAPYRVAQAYAWRGQPDEAFLWLDRAVVQRDEGLADIKYDPALRTLRGDARYRALLARLGRSD